MNMEVNWTLLSLLFIVYMAISGFSKGWWKGAITTAGLTGLVFLLQNPDWAEQLIIAANEVLATVWRLVPQSLISAAGAVFPTSGDGGAPQLNPTSPGVWVLILIVVLALTSLIGRVSFGNPPTMIGRLLGSIVGAVNGLLVLSLVREYLDGRALPGSDPISTEIIVTGSNSFAPATQEVAIRATGLPPFTIMDSAVPWIAIGLGAIFFFSVLKTRFSLASNNDGRKLATKLPPFYKKPAAPKRPDPTPVRIVQ